MIRKLGNIFLLETGNCSYIIKKLESGHLEHLYYGKKLRIDSESEAEVLSEKHEFPAGNTNSYSPEYPKIALEDLRLEMSSLGKGDIREPFIEVVHADGGRTDDFLFDSACILNGKEPLETLPSSYAADDAVQTLVFTLTDKNYGLTLKLYYSVFEKYDVITRSAKLVNTGDADVRLERLMSLAFDTEDCDWTMVTFNGAWGREMQKNEHLPAMGKAVNSSVCGTSSSRANPFVMFTRQGTTEDYGVCMGMNLIYSGNHYESMEVSGFYKTRFTIGIHPEGFTWQLAPGSSFETPEAVMTWSDEGMNGMSRQMHAFVRNCLVRGEWQFKERPVLLNSWEAAYMNINESRLLKLARTGKEVGIELFVMDDGWFGTRDDDKQSLGDWTENPKKLPNGLKGLCDKIRALGLEFGVWVEPEMVNVNSNLYRAHPDWTMDIPGKPHTEGRNQRILDLANPEVAQWVIDEMSRVFSSAEISYVKWDMNRIFSDVYSRTLPADRQGETAHRYMIGLYHIMKTLTEKFPHILFEGCASGGNRFDLGILSYFPQIWASDDTDAVYRVNGQTGYSYGYPMSTVGAHVSACPNHQTLRVTPLTSRFNVAAFGVLGYECNLCDMKKEELDEIKEEIAVYKKWRRTLQYGTFYRGGNPRLHEWTCVSPDRKNAVGMIMQELVTPNLAFTQYQAKGLDPDTKYSFKNRDLKFDVKDFGSLINAIAPVHVKQDSILHNVIAKVVSMPGEKELFEASGSVLMAGVKLSQAFSGTGYNDHTRYFQDFGSRIYFMEAKEEER